MLNPLLSRGNLRIMKTHFFLQVFVCTKKHWGTQFGPVGQGLAAATNQAGTVGATANFKFFKNVDDFLQQKMICPALLQ